MVALLRTRAPYLVAVASAVCAGIGNAALWPEFAARYPLIGFFPAIAVSGWFGGFGPGALCTLLGAMLTGYLWAAGGLHPGDGIFLSLFVIIGLLISSLYETLRRRTARAEQAESAAVRLARELKLSSDRLLEVELTARRQAEHANQLKNAFLAAVSHELRTPLSAIVGWTDILKQKLVNDERRDHALQAIYRNAQQQAHLLGELLDAARIDSATFCLKRERINLGTIVRDSWEVLEPAANAKGVRAGIDIDDDVSVMIFYGDGVRLRQVMTNLFSNAVKFTPPGGEVFTRVRTTDGAIEILVSDTGRGISQEFLPHVFEPFRQGDEPSGDPEVGFGLGLSIAKHLVEAHGGQIYATSDGRNRGARFTVRLPLTPTLVEANSGSRATA